MVPFYHYVDAHLDTWPSSLLCDVSDIGNQKYLPLSIICREAGRFKGAINTI